mmetsp:Transcript_9453/g.19961  ORF Transcript_9453/g.19961 Transcript_9453/m.19961 type:complete len:283 (-) Transcript_9453:353-1201(-)
MVPPGLGELVVEQHPHEIENPSNDAGARRVEPGRKMGPVGESLRIVGEKIERSPIDGYGHAGLNNEERRGHTDLRAEQGDKRCQHHQPEENPENARCVHADTKEPGEDQAYRTCPNQTHQDENLLLQEHAVTDYLNSMIIHGLLIHEIRSGGHNHTQAERQRKQIQQPGASVGKNTPHGRSSHQAAEIDPGPHEQDQIGSLVRLLAHALSVGGLREQVTDSDLHLGHKQAHSRRPNTRFRGPEVGQGCAGSNTDSQNVRGLPVPHNGHHITQNPEYRLHAPR